MSFVAVELAQNRYCESKSREHRKAAGQFFTPRWIAKGLAKWVMACKPDHILDPAVGLGILLDECRRQGYEGALLGYDVDKSIVDEWDAYLARQLGVQVKCQDFLDSESVPIASAIVNPPYNRFQNRDLSARLGAEVRQLVGLAASGFTNQYALFLYSVVSRLKAGGRAAFIVPSEFLATGYGEQVKAFLCRNRRMSHLVLFDTAQRIFPDAATTACVLLFDGTPQDCLNVWHLSGEAEVEVFDSLCGEQAAVSPKARIDYGHLNPQTNWQGLGLSTHDQSGTVPLSEFGDIKRGVATGANEFFLLRPSDVALHRIPESNLVSCIASAASAPTLVFDQAHIEALRHGDKPCYLFNGMGLEPSIEVEHYLRWGESQGLHQRYLTRSRKPWYRLESRKPASLLLAVFGRSGFRVCLNRTEAINLTAFHGFYPGPRMERWVPLIWLYFQGAMASGRFEIQQRAYGDGLKKLEPGDWAKLHVPDWRQWPLHLKEEALTLAHKVLASASSASQPGLEAACLTLDSLILKLSDEAPVKLGGVQASLI